MIASVAFALLPALYLLLILLYALVFFFKRRAMETQADTMRSFSVGVVFRNEYDNLKSLIGAMAEMQYPAYAIEFIFCDDGSEDGSYEQMEVLLENFPLPNRLSKLKAGAGKKAGLKYIAENAAHEFLLFTDADCLAHPGWVAAFNSFLEDSPDAKCILGPLEFCAHAPFLEKYQVLENTGLVLIGAASLQLGMPLMANGGNICYHKKEFLELCAFSAYEKIPTGDDIFMLDAFYAKFPRDCFFLKSPGAMVRTYVQNSWREFFSQRIRWSKKGFAQGKTGKFAAQVFFFGGFLSMILPLFLVPAGLLQAWVLLVWPAKMLLDLFFFSVMDAFFRTGVSIGDKVLVSAAQVFIIPAVAVASLFSGYDWKGRSYS